MLVLLQHSAHSQSVVLHAGLDYSSYNLNLNYQHSFEPVLVEGGLTYSLSDGSIESPVIGLNLGAYFKWAQSPKRRSYVGPNYKLTPLTDRVTAHLITAQTILQWDVEARFFIQTGFGFGAALEKGPMSTFSSLTASIQLGCGYSF